ncbi:2-phospho-L-lactate transferase [Leucobacter sp. Z1108]|uniref:2-phospho-L-lactate transferase n=1 Tax=Leucobacter sp. Z1108 TaxID=3439066 RepID=UPI003F2E4233
MKEPPKVVVLTGGVGGSKFVVGLRDLLVREHGVAADTSLTAVVNTGDDLWLTGVRLQPDLDSVIYALAGVKDLERGWGRAGETETVSAELREYGASWPWFTLGDLDLGTHLARTGWLREGNRVSEVVRRLAARWNLGVRILPMTDDEVDTSVVVREGQGEREMHFQEWWTRYRAMPQAVRFENRGISLARPAPGVREAILGADAVLLAPSNPVVSLGPILAVPGIREALKETPAPVVGVSPILGGEPVRGMADVCLQAIGVEVSARGVAAHYGSRKTGGLIDAFFIDKIDGTSAREIARLGIDPQVQSIWMRDEAESVDLASTVLDFAIGNRSAP